MRTKNLNKALVERIILLCVVFVSTFVYSGCKTLKQTNSSEVKNNTSATSTVSTSNDTKLDVKTSISSVINTSTSSSSTDKGITSETVEETSTSTKLSPPDSTGKQYPTETTTTKRSIKRGENKNLAANLGSKSDAATNAINEDKSKLKANVSQQNKGKSQTTMKEASKRTEKVKTSGWVYIAIVGLIGLLSFITYRILKRFNKIK